ncbi:MAG: hypothetical protein P4M08_01305 [Oligoflexia bacterium]|nr:hypothetical protein [Oligoflexia bacterium]
MKRSKIKLDIFGSRRAKIKQTRRSRISANPSTSTFGRTFSPGSHKLVFADIEHKWGYGTMLTVANDGMPTELQFENDRDTPLYELQKIKKFACTPIGSSFHFNEINGGKDQIIFDGNWSSGVYIAEVGGVRKVQEIWVRWHLTKALPKKAS